ncbi:MAG: 30S ribosomal protein S8 [Magnetococcales bacterium]|nr:30S ribosomal protein S8 [Magnetococcales bacterium]
MGMTDPISDMLARIRNGQMVKKSTVDIPLSSVKLQICGILREEGYLSDVEVLQQGEGGHSFIRVGLKYHQNRPVIEEIRRCSTPGCRRYVGKEKIPSVYHGLGIAILSTNRGVISSRQAKKFGVGGELLCTVF